jgi:hypothetical protein
MPLIDVDDILTDPDFVEPITVLRRAQQISNTGRVSTLNQTFAGILACVQPQSDQPMIRGPEQQSLPGLISVHTLFRIRGIAPGYQPDIVIWNGTQFVVNKVYNWSQYGRGYVMAECSSMDSTDQPPDSAPASMGGSGEEDDC